jgi:hypothetical protein
MLRAKTEERRNDGTVQWNEDVWSGFAAFLAEMIEKYAGEIDLDSLPDPPRFKKGCEEERIDCKKKTKHSEKTLENAEIL